MFLTVQPFYVKQPSLIPEILRLVSQIGKTLSLWLAKVENRHSEYSKIHIGEYVNCRNFLKGYVVIHNKNLKNVHIK